jgi:hypothetical protein
MVEGHEVRNMQRDTDLDPLRRLADFQELMKDLASRPNRSK